MMENGSESRIGNLLLKANLVTEGQLKEALEEQKRTGEKLGQILVERGVISPMDLARALEAQSGIPSITLEDLSFDPEVVNLLSENFIRSNRIIPLKRYNDTVEVACVPPINPRTLEDVRLITGLKVKPFIVTDEEFDRALNKALI